MKSFLKKRFPALWGPISAIASRYRKWRHNSRQLRLLQECYKSDFLKQKQFGVLGEYSARSTSLAAALRKTYHRLEKGLALPEPRPGFGEAMVTQLLREFADYSRQTEKDLELIEAVRASVRQYVEFHEDFPDSLSESLRKEIHRIFGALGDDRKDLGGVSRVHRNELLNAAKGDFQELLSSRHSIRNFDGTEVDRTLVEAAVALASNTPSACNRQCWRVYATSNPASIQNWLTVQNGNRGFGERISTLLLVTADRSAFREPSERNQCFVDAGLFAMNLINSLHYHGLCSCPLNLCILPGAEEGLQGIVGFEPAEAPVMMLAVGNMPENVKFAISRKMSLQAIMKWK